jgi:hypothetical protein
MASCTLRWFSDRGFELDLDVEGHDVALRMVGVPIPSDGTAELRSGPIELDRLDVLFKAQADVEGEPGQVQEASVQLVAVEGVDSVQLTAKVEDVETGELHALTVAVPVVVPAGCPEVGGPRPTPRAEDELDWEDETTLEQMVVNGPEGHLRDVEDESEGADEAVGLQRLLRALADLGQGENAEGEEPPPAVEPEENDPDTEPTVQMMTSDILAEADGDQSLSEDAEARALLDLLIGREALELEEDGTVSMLVPGAASLLALETSSDHKARAFSSWLLEEPAVADLYIDDEALAALLEQW